MYSEAHALELCKLSSVAYIAYLRVCATFGLPNVDPGTYLGCLGGGVEPWSVGGSCVCGGSSVGLVVDSGKSDGSDVAAGVGGGTGIGVDDVGDRGVGFGGIDGTRAFPSGFPVGGDRDSVGGLSCGVDGGGEGSSCDPPGGKLPLLSEVKRGKNYRSNKRKKLARKLRGSVASDGRMPLLEGAGVAERREFAKSRLEMMTERNKLAAARAVEQQKNVADRVFTRVSERKLELERLEVDAKLKKLEEADGSVFGFDGCTVASEPSLSTGTVSPDSSISVAEEMRLRRSVVKLQTQLKDTQLVLELERTVGGKEKDELKEKYALAVNANLERVAGGLVIKTSSTGKEFLGMANELDDDGESYPDIEFSQPSFNGEEVW